MEQTECSEMLAYKIQMTANYPEESVQHSEHGESLTLADEDSSIGNVTAVQSSLFRTNKEVVCLPTCYDCLQGFFFSWQYRTAFVLQVTELCLCLLVLLHSIVHRH